MRASSSLHSWIGTTVKQNQPAGEKQLKKQNQNIKLSIINQSKFQLIVRSVGQSVTWIEQPKSLPWEEISSKTCSI